MTTIEAHQAVRGKEEWLTIGEVARAFGVSQRTLRFYEDRGLLTPRRDGRSRLYGPRDRGRLTSILRAKRLGFTLSEIDSIVGGEALGGEHLALDREQVAQQIAHLERQRAGIDDALAELRVAQRRISAATSSITIDSRTPELT